MRALGARVRPATKMHLWALRIHHVNYHVHSLGGEAGGPESAFAGLAYRLFCYIAFPEICRADWANRSVASWLSRS